MNKQVLIDAISLLPELYDKTHKNYGNIDHRNQVWDTLAEKFGFSVEDIRNKWRNIRDAYQKALKKKVHCVNDNTMELYKAYKYEDHLKFLKPFCSATSKGVKRKNASGDEKFPKEKKSGLFYNTENEEYIQEIYENEEDQKTTVESDLQEEPEELFTCVQFEEQKEYEQSEQSVEDRNNLETELIYEEFNEEVGCKENSTLADKAVLETTTCNLTHSISVSKEADEMSKNFMSNFFLTVCNTVSSLPILLQAKIKKQVFDIVSEAEISYLTEQSIHK